MIRRSPASTLLLTVSALILPLLPAPALASLVPRTVFAEELGWVT